MRRGPVAVGGDPRDLGFELRDPLGQFALRIGVEAFPGEEAGCIAARPWAIVVVHKPAKMSRERLAVNGQRG